MKKIIYLFGTIAIITLDAKYQPNWNTDIDIVPAGDHQSEGFDTGKLCDIQYLPNWDSLDKRPLPAWYDRAKVGIFLHWGVFSVPSFHSEWFWRYWKDQKPSVVEYVKKNYPPNFTYQDFGPMFTAEFFDPDAWANLFENSGAKYVVLTTKHHEGFTLFPSKRSFSWNAMDVGPHRDLVGDLSKAVRKHGLKFGVYHSLFEWFNPIYLDDAGNNFTTQHFTDNKLWPDLKQLVKDYHPSVIWSDGDAGPDKYWKSEEFLAWLYNESPVKEEIVVNDRWGTGTSCKHGGFYSCGDRYNPGVLQPHKWENAFTVDVKSWGYRRNIELSQVMTIGALIKEIVSSVSCGGNVLINVGPTKEGTITPIFQERLLSLGKWLSLNGQGIYDTSPWFHQNDTINADVWYTCTKDKHNSTHPTAKPGEQDTISAIYAVVLKWPNNNLLLVRDIATKLRTGRWQIDMLGNEGSYLKSSVNSNGTVTVKFPDFSTVRSEHAWTLRFHRIKVRDTNKAYLKVRDTNKAYLKYVH